MIGRHCWAGLPYIAASSSESNGSSVVRMLHRSPSVIVQTLCDNRGRRDVRPIWCDLKDSLGKGIVDKMKKSPTAHNHHPALLCWIRPLRLPFGPCPAHARCWVDDYFGLFRPPLKRAPAQPSKDEGWLDRQVKRSEPSNLSRMKHITFPGRKPNLGATNYSSAQPNSVVSRASLTGGRGLSGCEIRGLLGKGGWPPEAVGI